MSAIGTRRTTSAVISVLKKNVPRKMSAIFGASSRPSQMMQQRDERRRRQVAQQADHGSNSDQPAAKLPITMPSGTETAHGEAEARTRTRWTVAHASVAELPDSRPCRSPACSVAGGVGR